MKLLHLTFILFIFFSSVSQAKINQLDDQDKQAVHQLVKKLADKLFLLGTTKYQSKKLQKELLAIMPDKIAIENEEYYINKKKYINNSIRLAIRDKDIVIKIIRKHVSPICYYLTDGSIDCDIKEKIKDIEKNDKIPQKPVEYDANVDYKFNLKMNETGDWYINKMKYYNSFPTPQISTLEIEKKYRQEELKNKRNKQTSRVRDNDSGERATRRPSKISRHKKTDVELAEEEAEKEEQELLFNQSQENMRIQSRTKNPKIRVDVNGNIIHNDTKSHSPHSRIKKKLKSSRRRTHPIYGTSRSWDRGKKWIPYYAVSYALEYAENYSPDYRSFFNDCANFVSQALTWGGWQNDNGWYSSSHAWWYNYFNQSYTWAGASNLHQYIHYQITQGNVKFQKYNWDSRLRPGDVLALTHSRTATKASHMMIVTSVHDGEIYVSGHTTNRKDKAWSKVDPNGFYVGWGYHIIHGNLR